MTFTHGDWPTDGGELGRLIRQRNWRDTTLGESASWEPALRSAVQMMLPAGVQIVMFWGKDYNAFYNDAYAPSIGDKHPDALGQPAKQYWGELWEDLEPLLAGVRSTGETLAMRDRPFQIDRRGFTEEVFFDISYSAIRDASGGVGGVLCIVKETTDQVQAIGRLDRAQKAGGVGAFEWYPKTNQLDASDGYRQLFGVAPGAVADTNTFMSLLHPDDIYRGSVPRVMNGDAPLDYIEFRIRRADTGEERWLSRRGEMVTVAGTPRLAGVIVDITERKRVEEALRDLNETLEAQVSVRTRERDRAWRYSRDLQVVVDGEGIFQAANPAWTPILGYLPEEVAGRSVMDFIHPDDVSVTRRALYHAHGVENLNGFENRYFTKEGAVRWISWLTTAEDDLVYAYGRDITDQKEAAEALARTEEQLRQAQKMEAVGQLTGGIAHDFNNLLQGITGSLDLMRRRIAAGRSGEVDRFISAAMTSAERASALTHRLLAFSRRQPLDPRPLKVNPLVATMEDLLRRTLGEQIELELVLAGGLWMTLCDANQLESAVLNLAINARDAMNAGGTGGKLTIETCNAHLDNAYAARDRDVTPGQYVCISVSDTGTGMSPEVIARAFDPFFTTKPIGQGTGLGLSMIYGFVRQSEGSIKLYSEPGEGTTAKLYLPRFRGKAPAPSLEPSFDAPDATTDSETVLVVEDEPIVRGLIVEVLSELGYRVIEASDGLQGQAVLRSDQTIDLLVTDIGLPGLNGRVMAESVLGERPNLRILYMTGYAENAALASGFLEPGMEMITKPFAMDAMARRVAEMLRRP